MHITDIMTPKTQVITIELQLQDTESGHHKVLL